MPASLAAALLALLASGPRHTFAAGPGAWLLDGKPYQIRCGEMHYPRIPRAYWADRFARAKAMGLNTICTYVFWDLQEPEPGKFDFSGNDDVAEFVREAQKAGLWVILRPGPYVCSEWDWGGFPYWLADIPGMAIRQDDPAFLKASGAYLDRLGRELAPLTVNRGGPIILCQVENEYGSFGEDHAYMAAIKRQLVHAGFDCQLETADGPSQGLLEAGTLPGVPAAVNFGGGAEGAFAELEKFRPGGPKMNGEFWCGWFDHWGETHHVGDPAGETADLAWMLDHGCSFSLYMAHGGTSFGWMAGANSGGPNHYEPDTTSYDYDAPIGEDGRLTPKFFAFRTLFGAHLQPGEALGPLPPDQPHIAIPRIEFDREASLLDMVSPDEAAEVRGDAPKSFEELHHPYGYVRYATLLPAGVGGDLVLRGLQDRAFVSEADGRELGWLDRRLGGHPIHIPPRGVARYLDILVENTGRVNFSRAMLGERKGFVSAELDGKPLAGWTMEPILLDRLDRATYGPRSDEARETAAPRAKLFRGNFRLDHVGDTFLEVHPDQSGWGFGVGSQHMGQMWVNGHNLGRWNTDGPQQTLYCPGPWLRKGANDVEVSDLRAGPAGLWVEGLRDPVFGVMRPPAE